MLKLSHIDAGYPGHIVLQDFSVCLKPNRLYMILGLNGSGKSTLLKVMGGWLAPFKGTVEIEGQDLSTLPSKQKANYTGRIATDFSEVTMPVERFVLLGQYHKQTWFEPYSLAQKAQVQKILHQQKLADLASKPMDQLSSGQKQRVAFAQTLMQDPICFFLDEPSSALDPHKRFELMEELLKLKSPTKIVVAVVHDLDLALRYADCLLILDQGRLVFCDTPFAFVKSQILEEVFSLRLENWDPLKRVGQIFPL